VPGLARATGLPAQWVKVLPGRTPVRGSAAVASRATTRRAAADHGQAPPRTQKNGGGVCWSETDPCHAYRVLDPEIDLE